MNSVKEEWRKVAVNDIYSVSNLGRVRNDKTGRILKQKTEKDGYFEVTLHRKAKQKTYRVHRLVALAFIPQLDKNRNEVDHIDYNKKNNRVDNLRWLTTQENLEHSRDRMLEGIKNSKNNPPKPVKVPKVVKKPIQQIDINTGEIVAEYPSLTDAVKATGFNGGCISLATNGKYLGKLDTYKGFKWQYIKTA